MYWYVFWAAVVSSIVAAVATLVLLSVDWRSPAGRPAAGYIPGIAVTIFVLSLVVACLLWGMVLGLLPFTVANLGVPQWGHEAYFSATGTPPPNMPDPKTFGVKGGDIVVDPPPPGQRWLMTWSDLAADEVGQEIPLSGRSIPKDEATGVPIPTHKIKVFLGRDADGKKSQALPLSDGKK